MLEEKNIYVLNLPHRKDRLLFTKIKMYRAGFNLDKINFIKAVYAREDKECINVFNSLPLTRKRLSNSMSFPPSLWLDSRSSE